MSSNEHIIHRDEERQLIGWLKQQGAVFHAPLQTVMIVSLAIFALQVGAFWWLANIADTMIVQSQSPKMEDVRLLGLAFVFILLLHKIKDNLINQTHGRICSTLQARLQYQMERGSHAMIRNESHYFWQQLWLDKIPAVGDYITKYRIQKKMATITPFIAVAIMWPVNWVIAVALIIAIPVVPLFMYIVGKGAANLHRQHFSALEKLGSTFVDRLKALTLLEVFNAHKSQQKTLEQASEQLNERSMKVVSVAFLSSSVLDFFSTLAVALVAVFVGFNLLGEVQLGAHLALHQGLFLLLVSPQIFAELKRLGKQYHQKAHAVAAAQHLMPIYEVEYPIQRPNQFSGIHWRNVKVESPVVTADELQLSAGDWVQLEGASGSGKTVFLEALMAQRPASHVLNANIAMLTQHAILKPCSLRENLTLGRRISDSRLWELLAFVELKEWAQSLPQGLDTPMGEAPVLSGGQQQRIAIARMLLCDADIILLDEPTAHLTNEQHQRISQLLRDNFKDKTVIWASHKPLNSAWFNRSWHMSDGILNDNNNRKLH